MNQIIFVKIHKIYEKQNLKCGFSAIGNVTKEHKSSFNTFYLTLQKTFETHFNIETFEGFNFRLLSIKTAVSVRRELNLT